ncbi:MAG: FKBP-type peptidyl-prolyl cis-trans isomerase N-terminal domain-containing protein [Acidobacteriota bacterium]|nr:FKBP-type peptidyl-prolyl cis-trans isomerase N-terminal domain-containing protein [Acidobacteriota bacterium]
MKTSLLAALAAASLLAAPSLAADPAAPPASSPDDSSTLYALGVAVSRNLLSFDLSEKETAEMLRGLSDGLAGKADIDINAYQAKIVELQSSPLARRLEKEKAAASAFLAQQAQRPGAEKLDSGLIFETLEAGQGDSPSPTSQLKVYYKGSLRDGTVFDSRLAPGEPAEIPLTSVISCWKEACPG